MAETIDYILTHHFKNSVLYRFLEKEIEYH